MPEVKMRTLEELTETQNKAAIARKLGVDSATVYRWVRRESMPPADKLLALAEILGVDPSQIDLTVHGAA
jgi:transcriptional regulator with XRE-family HTH domain